MTQPVWQPPNVVRKAQPLGSRGATFSLEEVARRATEGRLDPLIVAWARRTVNLARPATQAGQAAALLDAQRANVVYVPDPVHAEHMQSARITLAFSQGGDCDDVTILYLAACMALGLRCHVVGHGYDADDTIQHVLGRVHCEGGWHYAEPSQMGVPFGTLARKPTWERFIDLPVVPGRRPQTLCNATSCDTSALGSAAPSPLSHSGDFVGVGLVPGRSPPMRLHPALARLPRSPGLGGLFDAASPDSQGEIAQARADVGVAWGDLHTTHDQMWADAQRLGASPFPELAPGGPLGWSVDDENRYLLLKQTAQTLTGSLTEALAGARKIVQDSVSNLLGIASSDSDAVVFSTDSAGKPVLTSRTTGTAISLDTGGVVCAAGFRNNPAFTPQNSEPACIPVPGAPSGVSGLRTGAVGIGAWQVVVGVVAGVLVFLGVIYAIVQVMREQTEQARLAANRARDEERARLITGGFSTPEQENEYDKTVLAKTEAEAKIAAEANAPKSYAELLKNGAIFLAAAGGVYLVYKIVSGTSSALGAGPRVEIVNEPRYSQSVPRFERPTRALATR